MKAGPLGRRREDSRSAVSSPSCAKGSVGTWHLTNQRVFAGATLHRSRGEQHERSVDVVRSACVGVSEVRRAPPALAEPPQRAGQALRGVHVVGCHRRFLSIPRLRAMGSVKLPAPRMGTGPMAAVPVRLMEHSRGQGARARLPRPFSRATGSCHGPRSSRRH